MAQKLDQLMKSLIRTVLSNPQKLSDLHKAVMYEVSNKNHINIVNTDKLIGSDHEFAELMNRRFPHFKVNKRANMGQIQVII